MAKKLILFSCEIEERDVLTVSLALKPIDHDRFILSVKPMEAWQNHTKSVLIIGEDNALLDSVAAVLRTHGFLARQQDHGDISLQYIRDFKPDVVLIDMDVACIKTFDFCKSLKNESDLSEIPIVLMFSSLRLEDRIRGFLCGVQRYINKPVTVDEIVEHLRLFTETGRHRFHEANRQYQVSKSASQPF